jgi:hypothetical protein
MSGVSTEKCRGIEEKTPLIPLCERGKRVRGVTLDSSFRWNDNGDYGSFDKLRMTKQIRQKNMFVPDVPFPH